MRCFSLVVILVLLTSYCAATPSPLRFEPNHGQTDEAVAFLARGAQGTAFFRPGSIVIRTQDGIEPGLITLRFVDAEATVEGQHRLPGVTHYLRGSDPTDWVQHVPGFAAIRYASLYPDLDLIVGGHDGTLAFSLHASSLDEIGVFAFTIDGARAVTAEAGGGLQVHTAAGLRNLPAPTLVEASGAERLGRFVVHPDGHIRIEATASIPHASASPQPGFIGYASFLGGMFNETGRGIVADADGHSYITGDTDSPDFPGAPPTALGSIDVFVTKLAPDGMSLVYSTLLIGTSDDLGYGIALLDDGSVVVTGDTGSGDFPTTPGAFDTSFNGGGIDAFVFRLAPDGASLLYSTFLGGAGPDFGRDIAVDAAGSAFAVGGTGSPGFPTTPGVVGPTPFGSEDTFATKLTPSGDGLMWSTFIGGSDGEFANSIALLGGEAFITGETVSGDLPTTPGVFGPTFSGASDAFVARLAPDASAFAYLTYLGGIASDMGEGIAVDPSGTAFVGGITSTGFPVTPDAAFPTPSGFEDAFLALLAPDGVDLVYSTYYGGSDLDFGCDVALDDLGLPVIVGKTNSTDLPVSLSAPQPIFGGITDGFYARFDPSIPGADSFLDGTFIGGSNPDIAHAVGTDPDGVSHITGFTESPDFPTSPDAYDDGFNGGIKDVMMRRIPKDFIPVAISDNTPDSPRLTAPAPNPFLDHATLSVTLSAPEPIRATLVDERGRTVAVVWEGVMPSGTTRLVLPGTTLPSGVYLLRLQGETFSETRRVTRLR